MSKQEIWNGPLVPETNRDEGLAWGVEVLLRAPDGFNERPQLAFRVQLCMCVRGWWGGLVCRYDQKH